jgi:hypothetical protein
MDRLLFGVELNCSVWAEVAVTLMIHCISRHVVVSDVCLSAESWILSQPKKSD